MTAGEVWEFAGANRVRLNRSRWIRAAQFAGFGAAAWLIWLQAAACRAQGIAVRPLVLRSLLLEFAAWGVAAAVTLAAYMASSMAEFRKVLGTAVSAAIPAVWCVPCALLLATGTPLGTAGGLLLAANTARVLASRRPPGVYSGSKRKRNPESSSAQVFLPVDLPWHANGPLAGALVLQAGVCCAIGTDYRVAAAALVAAGAAVCTWCSIQRGAYTPRQEANLPHLALSVALVLLLALTPMPMGAGRPGPAATPFAYLWGHDQLAEAETPAQKQNVTPVFTPKPLGAHGADGFPAALLIPEAPVTRGLFWGSSGQPAMRALFSQPFVVPFTGEYHLYPSPLGHMPASWVIFRGTPLDGLYVTLNGAAMDTEAYQKLNPPVDFSTCRSVRVGLSSEEASPANARMELIGSSGTYDLGSQFFGLSRSTFETLEFKAPAAVPRRQVNAIRIVFRRGLFGSEPDRAQNAKVAVRWLEFAPRR